MMAFCEWEFTADSATCIHCGLRVTTRSRTIRVLCSANRASDLVPIAVNYQASGPGTQLKAMLAGWPLYITATADCPCNQHAAQMDAWGCDGCAARLDEIVGWLQVEAERRGLPFADVAGRLLVRRAISRARRHDPHRNRRQLPQNAGETGI